VPRLRPRGRHRKPRRGVCSIRASTLRTAGCSPSSTRSASRRNVPGERRVAVHRPGGHPRQDDRRREADRHPHVLNFATGRPVWQLKDASSVEAARPQTPSVSIDHDRARLISPSDAFAHDPKGVRLQPAEGGEFSTGADTCASRLASEQVDALPGT